MGIPVSGTIISVIADLEKNVGTPIDSLEIKLPGDKASDTEQNVKRLVELMGERSIKKITITHNPPMQKLSEEPYSNFIDSVIGLIDDQNKLESLDMSAICIGTRKLGMLNNALSLNKSLQTILLSKEDQNILNNPDEDFTHIQSRIAASQPGFMLSLVFGFVNGALRFL